MLTGYVKVPREFATGDIRTGRTVHTNTVGMDEAASTQQHISNSFFSYSTFTANSVRNTTVPGSTGVNNVGTTETGSGYNSELSGGGNLRAEQFNILHNIETGEGGGGTTIQSAYALFSANTQYEIIGTAIHVSFGSSTWSQSGFTVDITDTVNPPTHTSDGITTSSAITDSQSFANTPRTATGDIHEAFGCTITTVATTDTHTFANTTSSTDSFTFPIGTTTRKTNSQTAYTTVSTSVQTSTWDYTTVTVNYTRQSTTFENEVQWNLWDARTIIIPQRDLLMDDWIWLVYPNPGVGAYGEISELAFSIDSEFPIEPPERIGRVFAYPLIGNNATSSTQGVTNPYIAVDQVTKSDPVVAASDTFAHTYYKTTYLPMESTVTTLGVETSSLFTHQEAQTVLSSSSQNMGPVAALTQQSVDHAVTNSVNRWISWVDSNNNVNLLSTTTSSFSGARETYGTVTTVTGFVASSTDGGTAGGGFGGTTINGATDTLLDHFDPLPFAVIDRGFFLHSYPSVVPFVAQYPWTNDKIFQLQPSMNTSDNVYQGLDADFSMPYFVKAASAYIHDEAGATIPFMFFYKTGGAISGSSSFSSSATTWHYKWDGAEAASSSGMQAKMSVTSKMSGFIGTSTGIVESHSFENQIYGLGAPQSTVIRPWSIPITGFNPFVRGTIYGGRQQPSATSPMTLLLAGAYSTTEISDDTNWGTTFYSDWTTTTIPTSVLVEYERTTLYQVSSLDTEFEEAQYFLLKFSKHAPGTYQTTITVYQ